MKNFNFSLILLLVFSCNFVLADVFTFQLRGYPKKERNCHLQTEAVGAEFELGTQLKVLHVECVAERLTGYDFAIEYEASQRLELVSTDYSFTVVNSTGRYKQQAECLNQLPFQIQLFEKSTGLNPFFSYCRSLELEAGKNWEVILMAQGKASLSPEFGGFLMFGRPVDQTVESLSARLRNALQNQGAVLADLVFHYDSIMGMGGGSVHYYASKRIEFHLERISQVPKLEQCHSQANEMEKALSPFGQNVFAIYCGDRNLGYHDLHLGFLDKPGFSWLNSVDTFVSFSDCEQHRLEVLKHYEGSATEKLLAGFCSRNYQNEKYQVVILRARKS